MYEPFPRKQGRARKFLHRRPSRAFGLSVAMVVITISLFVVLSPSHQRRNSAGDITSGSNQAGDEPLTKLLVEDNDASEGEAKHKEDEEAAEQAKPESPVTFDSDYEVDDKDAEKEDTHDAEEKVSEDRIGELEEAMSEGAKEINADGVAGQPDFAPEGSASAEGNDVGMTVDDDGDSNEPGDHSNDASDHDETSRGAGNGSADQIEEADDDMDSKGKEEDSINPTMEEGEGDKDSNKEDNDVLNSESDLDSIEKGSVSLKSSEGGDDDANSIEEGVDSENLDNEGNDDGDFNKEDDGSVDSSDDGEDGGMEGNSNLTPNKQNEDGASSGDTRSEDRDDSSDVAALSAVGQAAVTTLDKTTGATFNDEEQVTPAEDPNDSTSTAPDDDEVAFGGGEPGTNPEPDAGNESYDTPAEKPEADLEQPAAELASARGSAAPDETAAELPNTADDGEDTAAPIAGGDLVDSESESSGQGEVESKGEEERETADRPKEEADVQEGRAEERNGEEKAS